LEKKENYVLNIIKSDIIKLEFIQINELTKIELKLDIFPIRKDLSTNAEIITLKKTINNLQKINKIIDNFIFHDNLTNPINLSYKGPICLSNINAELINLIFSKPYQEGDNAEYLINSNINITKIMDSIARGAIFCNYYNDCGDGVRSIFFRDALNPYRIKNYNFNIIQEHLKLLQSEYIIFYKINITDKIINELNDNITKIIFVECLIIVDNLYNNKINELHFYICKIENMNGFKIMNMISNIYFYCTPEDNINKKLFSPLVNFTNNYINCDATIILI